MKKGGSGKKSRDDHKSTKKEKSSSSPEVQPKKDKTKDKTNGKKKSSYGKSRKIFFWGKKRQCFDPLSSEVPPIVEDTISYLELNGALTSEGIFRRSGSAALTKQLHAKYDKGKQVTLVKMDIHTVAGVLILFFRTLSNPLLTFELYECFVSATGVLDPQTRLECIHQCVDLLPPGNKAVLTRLVGFLRKVNEHKDENKMDVKNLGIVFAPTMLRPPGAPEATITSLLGDSLHTHRLMEAFILNYNEIFGGRAHPSTFDQRSSMTPNQRAEFFKTLKRGTMKLASAMILAEEFGKETVSGNGDIADSSDDSSPSDGETTTPAATITTTTTTPPAPEEKGLDEAALLDALAMERLRSAKQLLEGAKKKKKKKSRSRRTRTKSKGGPKKEELESLVSGIVDGNINDLDKYLSNMPKDPRCTVYNDKLLQILSLKMSELEGGK